MINLNLQVVYFYYGVNDATGNKGKYYVCFKHAVKHSVEGKIIETEIKHDESYYFCETCQNE